MINFMSKKWLYFLISAIVIIPGLFSMFRWGLRPSIDFTGGTIWELKFDQDVSGKKDDVISTIQNNGGSVELFQSSASKTYRLRLKFLTSDENKKILDALNKKYGKVEQIHFGTVGPTLGRELLEKTVIAVILASLTILIYIAIVFKNFQFGASAILAVLHDVLVVLGVFSLLGHFLGVEVDTLFVTALLTIMSFSVHDTVVVYDRIRESARRNPGADFTDLTNKAVTETLSRSLNNSLTIIFMLLALVLLGGLSVKWFAMALLVGTISGTYSSTFTAAPILVIWQRLKERRKKK